MDWKLTFYEQDLFGWEKFNEKFKNKEAIDKFRSEKGVLDGFEKVEDEISFEKVNEGIPRFEIFSYANFMGYMIV